jgi:hypothetical protein
MEDKWAALEVSACTPTPIDPTRFNPNAELPYGCTVGHIQQAMEEFIDFLGFINQQLATKSILRFESMLMPANFSSMVGEFMNANIPKYCPTIAKNTYHNGHPDLVPKGLFPKDAVQHSFPLSLTLRSGFGKIFAAWTSAGESNNSTTATEVGFMTACIIADFPSVN